MRGGDPASGASPFAFLNDFVVATVNEIITKKTDEFNQTVENLKTQVFKEIYSLAREIPGIRDQLVKDLRGVDGYTPIKGKDYFDGKAGQKPVLGIDYFIPEPITGPAGSPDKPDDVVEKVNNATKKVLQESVENLPETIAELKNTIRTRARQIGGGGGTVTYKTPSGAVNGTNDAFTVTSKPIHIVSDGIVYFENNGYTLAGLAVTMTVPPSQYIRYAV